MTKHPWASCLRTGTGSPAGVTIPVPFELLDNLFTAYLHPSAGAHRRELKLGVVEFSLICSQREIEVANLRILMISEQLSHLFCCLRRTNNQSENHCDENTELTCIGDGFASLAIAFISEVLCLAEELNFQARVHTCNEESSSDENQQSLKDAANDQQQSLSVVVENGHEKVKGLPVSSVMKKYYPDYNPRTAEEILLQIYSAQKEARSEVIDWKVRDIANQIGINRGTVSRYLSAFKRAGLYCIGDLPLPGKPRK